MNANRQSKEAIVNEISQKLADSKALVVATYAGLTVGEVTNLRTQLTEAGVEFKVYKNRLFKIAAKAAGIEIDDSLTGPNAFAFGMEDDISPAKIIAKFAKDHKVVKFVAGTFEGKVVSEDELKDIATLPTMEEALTKLALALMTPLKDTAIGLNMLVEEGHLKGDTPTEEAKTDNAPAEETKEEESKDTAPATEEVAKETITNETPTEESSEEKEATTKVEADAK